MKNSFSFRTIILGGSLLLQLSAFCFHSRGAAGDVDLSFDPGSGVNGPVRAVAVQADGKTIIGGQFTTANGLLRTNLARLNADGSGDATFNPAITYNPYSLVTSLALQSDGKVLVGNEVSDTTCDDFGCFYFTELQVTRLNTDGSLDASFNPSTGLGNYSNVGGSSLVVQTNGKVLIGGGFYTVNGANRNHIARLNANGTLDTSFNPGTGVGGSYPAVNSVSVQADGKVLIGGLFEAFNGTNRNNIARLNADGSLDLGFNAGSEANGPVLSVAMQADGKVLIGGDFSTVSGTNRGIARLNADGSLDGTFNPGTGLGGFYPWVTSVAVQTDGKVFIGGRFTAVNGTNSNRIARLNATGSLDTSFDPGTGANGGITTVALQPDGRVLVVGYFTMVNGTNRNGIARLNADGSLDGGFNPGRGVAASFLVVQPDGKVLVGGLYTFINGTNRYGSARLNADGSVDNTFIQDNSFNPDLGVVDTAYSAANSLVVQSDGKVLIGGYTYTELDAGDGGYFPVYTYFLTRFNANGSRDTSFEPAVGNQSFYDLQTVRALAVQPDGKIVVGGTFSNIKGTNRNGIARLNANGSLDNGFNVGTGNYFDVYSVALQSDGQVLVGGLYNVNGTNRGIARLNPNGSLDGSFNPGGGVDGVVRSIAVQPDGKVLIGGDFTFVHGTNRNHIARLNANGSQDSAFNPGTGADGVVRSIGLQSDGKVLIGGGFFTVNGGLRPHVARLYGDSVAPSLNIARSNASLIVSWPLSAAAFVIDQSPTATGAWSQVAFPYTTNATSVSISAPSTTGNRFYRLRRP